MSKVHDRVLQLNLTLNAAGDSLAVTSLTYFRDRGQLDAGTGSLQTFTPATAQTSPAEIVLGEVFPPPTHLRFVFAAF